MTTLLMNKKEKLTTKLIRIIKIVYNNLLVILLVLI